MSKFIKLLLIILTCFAILSGCSKEQKEKFNCNALDHVKMFVDSPNTAGYFITDNGELYAVGKYSDGTDCKKIETNVKFKGHYQEGLGSFVGEDNELYELRDNSIVPSSEKNKYQNVIKTSPIIFENDYNEGKYTGYILKEDGRLYLHHHYTDEKDTVFKAFHNEKILDFDTGYGYGKWIKTDRAYYISRIKNEDCTKYDDINCEYEFVKSKKLTKLYNEISFLGKGSVGDYYYVLKEGTIVRNIDLN